MKFSVLTLFPEMYSTFCRTSIVKHAIERGITEIECINIRDFSNNKFRHIDDTPYGGGAGMLMQVEPIDKAIASVRKENSYVVLMSPKARPYKQADARRLMNKEHIVIICGHYEGLDYRAEELIDEKISIGDYVLSGGEVASMVVMDSIIRLQKGVIRDESLDEESFDNALLEYPQFTKPAEYKGRKVPEILLGGNHAKIRLWRKKMALYETLKYRKDLLRGREFSEEEIRLLHQLKKELEEGKDPLYTFEV